MSYEPRKPTRLGAERREMEAAAVAEIAGGGKCPECGGRNYHPEGGCWVCRDCGYSPCK